MAASNFLTEVLRALPFCFVSGAPVLLLLIIMCAREWRRLLQQGWRLQFSTGEAWVFGVCLSFPLGLAAMGYNEYEAVKSGASTWSEKDCALLTALALSFLPTEALGMLFSKLMYASPERNRRQAHAALGILIGAIVAGGIWFFCVLIMQFRVARHF